MPDRAKVIKELEWSLKTSCVDETSVIVPQDTVNDVLALLKEHPEPMDDLISRKAAMDVFMGMPPDFYHTSYIVGEINCLPSVDAVPVMHGRWLKNKYGETVCSECNNDALQVLTGCLVNRHFEYRKSKFCPNCGAKMDKEE